MEMNEKQLEMFEKVKSFLSEINYELLQDYYLSNRSKLKLKCCNGHEYESTWVNLQAGKRCKKCAIEKQKRPIEEIINMVEQEGYTFIQELEEFKERRIMVRCPEGHEYDVSVNKFKLGRRCPICNDNTFEYDYVKSYIENEGYKLLTTNYINVYQKLEMVCPKGHILKMNFHGFKNGGRRCSRCKVSKGEKTISEVLTKLNIEYEIQKTFKDCKDIKVLPFDFYLPQYNLIIEYDGEQHFAIKHAFDEDSFWITVVHDAIKNQYCEDNNINILRIPYWEFDNIEELITNKLIDLRGNFND